MRDSTGGSSASLRDATDADFAAGKTIYNVLNSYTASKYQKESHSYAAESVPRATYYYKKSSYTASTHSYSPSDYTASSASSTILWTSDNSTYYASYGSNRHAVTFYTNYTKSKYTKEKHSYTASSYSASQFANYRIDGATAYTVLTGTYTPSSHSYTASSYTKEVVNTKGKVLEGSGGSSTTKTFLVKD